MHLPRAQACVCYFGLVCFSMFWSQLRPRDVKSQHARLHDVTSHRITAQHSTAQHSTAQHSTAQHSTAQCSLVRHVSRNI